MKSFQLLQIFRRTPFHPQWLLKGNEELTKWITASSGGKILDIGCADRWIERILPADTQYIGVDYPVTGKNLYKSIPDVYADAAQLPFATNSIDCVILFEALEHIGNPQCALAEIARVLRPGGTLLLTMPFMYPIHDAPHDYQRLTSHGLHRDIQKAGLRISSIHHRLNAIESASMLACLALGGSALQTIQQRKPGLLLIPLIALMIPMINVAGWSLGKLLPHWTAFTSGFRISARKPEASEIKTAFSTHEAN